jgi:serine/threonine protein kinase
MQTAESWKERWHIEKPLGAGGQGDTFLVKEKETDRLGVLKLLRDEIRQDKKARARMAQEAINLDIVADAGGKVPRVLENGTSGYKDLSSELYFVMEYIEGESLKTVIQKEKRLLPEKVLEIGVTLSSTIAIGHSNNILHRDIKPDNIIVRSLEPVDAWMVDYGLSFNETVEHENDLTDLKEKIGNRFSDLPERHTPSAKRQRESDTAAICGVIVYCLSGRFPTPLLDAHGNPPHRQYDNEIEKNWPSNAVLAHLFGVLDRGLRYNPADRFSSGDELHDRLRGVTDVTKTRITDIRSLLKAESRQLKQQSREVRLGDARDRLKHQFKKLQRTVTSPDRADEFIVDAAAAEDIPRLGLSPVYEFPSGVEEVYSGFVYEVALRRRAKARIFIVAIGILGEDLQICCARSAHRLPLVGRARSLHKISYSAPSAVGGLAVGRRPHIAPSHAPVTPKLQFGALEVRSTVGLDFLPSDEVLTQMVLSEIANGCSELRDEVKS